MHVLTYLCKITSAATTSFNCHLCICKLHEQHISYFILMIKWLLSTKNTFDTQTVTTRLFLTYLTLSTHLSLKIKIEDNYFCWFCTNEFCSQVYFDVKMKQFCSIWLRLKELWVLKNIKDRCNWIYYLMKYFVTWWNKILCPSINDI